MTLFQTFRYRSRVLPRRALSLHEYRNSGDIITGIIASRHAQTQHMDAINHQQAGEINGDEEEMEVVTEKGRTRFVDGYEDRFMDRQNYFICIGMLIPIPATKMQTYCECGDVVSSTFNAHRKGGPDLTDILLQ